MPLGTLSFVLHAHLPYVRHPEHESFLEERWLFEALTETYIPLLRVFERLVQDDVRFRLTVSLSPTLLAMLDDPLIQQRYLTHLAKQLELAEREVKRTADDPALQPVARMYARLLVDTVRFFKERQGGDLVGAFRSFQDAGVLELITCAGTHGYLPLLRTQPEAVRAQIRTAAVDFARQTGRAAQGLWLPECAYYPGLEEIAQDSGFRYLFVETHGLAHATPRPRDGVFAPIACPNGVAVFARDPESTTQVWSAEQGYPGDAWYREFYRDIGFDLPLETIGPYVEPGGTRVHTGFKYHRITGKTEDKRPYDPIAAAESVAYHADHFVAQRKRAAAARAGGMDRPPHITCPYDAELFGHWWFEGPLWLEAVIRRLAAEPEMIAMITPTQYLSRNPTLQRATPAASSWGDQGYNEVWLNPANDWIYPHLHDAARTMRELARSFPELEPGSLFDRALAQAARSLLLAQASDWPFIQKTGTSVEFAQRNLKDHLGRFHTLAAALRRGAVDERELRAFEFIDRIFPQVDPRVYAG